MVEILFLLLNMNSGSIYMQGSYMLKVVLLFDDVRDDVAFCWYCGFLVMWSLVDDVVLWWYGFLYGDAILVRWRGDFFVYYAMMPNGYDVIHFVSLNFEWIK